MQKKPWYYEKRVGRHGFFPPRLSVIFFRCQCKNCRNEAGENIEPPENESQEKKSTHAGRLNRIADTQFYENLGIPIVQPRWKFEETLLLFFLLDREVLEYDLESSNIKEIQKRYNVIAGMEELSEHTLNKKSIKQIHGKISNMLKYVGTYNRLFPCNK